MCLIFVFSRFKGYTRSYRERRKRHNIRGSILDPSGHSKKCHNGSSLLKSCSMPTLLLLSHV